MHRVLPVLFVVFLAGCNRGITTHPLSLPMKHSLVEESAIKKLHIQKNPNYVLPTTDKNVHDSLYDPTLVIPEDLREGA